MLTAIAGPSDVVDRRFPIYAREAKSEMIGIPSNLILAAAALRSLSAWHDSTSQRGPATLSEWQVFPENRTAAARIAMVARAFTPDPRAALTVAG